MTMRLYPGSPRLNVRREREAIAQRWLAGARAETPYDDDCRKLWVMVMAVAISDLTSPHALHRASARAWVESRDTEPASFEWICKLLDADPGEVRARLSGEGVERMSRVVFSIRSGRERRRDGAA